MSENLQKILREALLNNSYDYQPMHNTLKRTWTNSFSYLYALQKAEIEYEELSYVSNDVDSRNSKLIGGLYLDRILRASFNIEYDLIHVYNREEFRLSKFYDEEFTFKDMIYHPSIFSKIPIIIIDNQVIWDYKLKVGKDTMTVILPFKKNFVISPERKPDTEDIIYLDHKIQVLIVDNIFYQRFELNKNTLYFNKNDKTIKIDKSFITQMNSDVVRKETDYEMRTKWGITTTATMTNNQSYEFQKEYKRRLDATQLPEKTGVMMCSLHFLNNVGKSYELGTQMIPMEDKGEFYIAYLTDDIVDKLDNHNFNIYISLWFVNRLRHHKFYTGLNKTVATNDGADLLVVQQEEMVPYKTPIPVENFMVFKQTNNTGFFLQKNTEMLEMFYPNIYRVKDTEMNTGDEYDIYYFYYDQADLKYTVLFDFYFTFLFHLYNKSSTIEKIINDIYYNRIDLTMYTQDQQTMFINTFKKLIDYQYYNHQYAEIDFLNRYLPLPGNQDKAPIEYKIETMRDWIRVEPWVLRDYVLEQNKLGASYHLFTNTIDLASRIRYNTELEIGELSRTFDEPRYVFAFNNNKDYPIMLNCRVFVDGILVGDLYQERHLFMDYLYIPTYLVTNDSYIEIEIFPMYEYERDIFFTTQRTSIKVIGNILTILVDGDFVDNETVTLTDDIGFINDDGDIDINDYNKKVRADLEKPQEVIYPTISDVYLMNQEMTEVYEKENFDITVHYPNEDYEFVGGDPGTEKPVQFTRISSFSIKPHDETLLRKPLHLKITKTPRTVRIVVKRQGYVSIELAEKGLILDEEYIRIYKDGRLIPRSKYKLSYLGTKARILFLDWFCVGEIIFIDITPYKYKEIYYQEELSKDNTLIDLKTIINKPFDIRYYDVYINGRKLSLNNVFSISPTQITLVNLKSNYNLVIFERERDPEYFGLDYTENMYYYTIEELFNSGIVSDDIKNEMIKDIIDSNKDPRLNIYPNTNYEEKIDQTGEDLLTVEFYIYYYDRLLPFTYMNPDRLQESQEFMLNGFEDVFNAYVTSSTDEFDTEADKERKENYPKVICLDPDLEFCAEGGGDGPKLVYEVGHMTDDINKFYLDQGVFIPLDSDIEE